MFFVFFLMGSRSGNTTAVGFAINEMRHATEYTQVRIVALAVDVRSNRTRQQRGASSRVRAVIFGRLPVIFVVVGFQVNSVTRSFMMVRVI
jgi:hypothetical protein